MTTEYDRWPDAEIQRRVKGAGTAMVLVAATSIAVLAVSFAFSSFLLLSGLVDELPQPEAMSKRTQVSVRLLLNVVCTSASVVCLRAGLSMRRMRNYRSAHLGAALASVPCISPCLLLGIPIGLWSLSILRHPGVREGFQDERLEQI